MKILLVSHFFPPQRIAGAEKLALGYALELQKKGHSVQVLTAGEWEAGPLHWNGTIDETVQGIAVRRVNLNWTKARNPNRSLYDNPEVETRLGNWLDEWKPDIVHVISLITLSAAVARVVKQRGIPLAFTLVDFWMICPKINLVRGDGSLCEGQATSAECLTCLMWKTKAFQQMRRVLPEKQTEALLGWTSRTSSINRVRGLRGMALNMDERKRVMAEIAPLFDSVMAPSTKLGSVIDRSGLFRQKVRIIHSGHDLSWLSSMPAKQPSQQVRLGYIGQLIPVKGVDKLIRAFQLAGGEGKAQLLIHGDDSSNPQYAGALRDMAQSSTSIHFMGSFPHSRLGEVLAQMDVLVVPSQWHENNPRVIQEAFAGKTPVIASNVGGIAEFIQHGVNGLLFERSSVDDLRAQIERVLNEPGLIRRLESGIGRVKTMSEEIDEVIKVYQELVPAAF